MDKTVLSLFDEQPARDRRLPLGGDPRGAPGRVHGGVREGERGGGCRGVREVCWEIDVRRGVFFCAKSDEWEKICIFALLNAVL